MTLSVAGAPMEVGPGPLPAAEPAGGHPPEGLVGQRLLWGSGPA